MTAPPMFRAVEQHTGEVAEPPASMVVAVADIDALRMELAEARATIEGLGLENVQLATERDRARAELDTYRLAVAR